MSPDPNRARPRSSKKRRATQGGPAATSGPVTQRVPAGRPRPRDAARPGSGRSLPTVWLAAVAVVVVAVGLGFASGVIDLGGGRQSGGSPAASADTSADGSGGPANGSGSGACPKSAPAAAPAGLTRRVTIETAKGPIQVAVDANLGPRAAANFIALAACGFYDRLVFHRVVTGFVIQGGDPTGTGGGGPGYEFADDPVTVPYVRGVVAMANSGPNTNGSQFFIVLADSSLAPNYSVFGRVTAGMDAVDAIAAAADRENPSHPIAMDKVTVSNP